jgi:L-asparaginase II
MPPSAYLPIFELTRDETVESIHYGAVAVVNAHGQLIASYGNPQAISYLRSSAKPFQAIPFIEHNGNAHFDLSQREIALMCASHAGTDEHVAVLNKIQDKANLSESDLMCGVHPPFDVATAKDLGERGEQPTPNRHNCSGKHTGMLAYARMQDLPLKDYINPDHPIQSNILLTFAEMCELPLDQIAVGTDGCSAPIFAVPLYNVALAYARLCDPVAGNVKSESRLLACRTISAAMTTQPFMVSGLGQFDTRLMEISQGRLISKGGAEGYQGIGLLPGAFGPGSPALGIALKIADGDLKSRARAAISIEVLRQLAVLSRDELDALAKFGPILPVHNWRKLVVGQARPCFKLKLNDII